MAHIELASHTASQAACPPCHNAVLFEDVCVQRGNLPILKHIDAHIPLGGCTAVIGPNGAGKTSLLMTLLGELPYKGAVHIPRGKDGGTLRLGYVPQRVHIDRGMPLTVIEFLVMGVQRKPLWLGVDVHLREASLQLLAMVHAENLARRRIGDLSGGELQRVLLALALQQDPELLILDEASAGVDFHGEQLFCELLEELREERGFTQLMVSHDLGMVAHHATHVICLSRRLVAEGPPQQVLTTELLLELFGIHMGIISTGSEIQEVCRHTSIKEL